MVVMEPEGGEELGGSLLDIELLGLGEERRS